jgi:superfamily I DNA and/or RNA helicase
VLIEEAAEILEAHVLTCLSPSVKRLIMIGDHQQLRPKLEHYPLRKESGKGIDFDVSLFERLVTKSSFPASLLNVQHRMRPEISRLIRPIYPSLEDHPSVSNRENLLGINYYNHFKIPHNEIIILMCIDILFYFFNRFIDLSLL